VVVNTAWLEEQFPAALGDGTRFGLAIHWSAEGRDHGGALETAGGIAKALPLLGDVFWVVSGDVFLPGFGFDPAAARAFAAGSDLAHLWLVPNPPHHPEGDFALGANGRVVADGPQRLTWASVGLFRAELFAGIAPGAHLRLRPLLERAIAAGRLGATRWEGGWTDVGTPERLAAIDAAAAA
jgi:MurNAc alpha-1-phosphate uridylyltransferase